MESVMTESEWDLPWQSLGQQQRGMRGRTCVWGAQWGESHPMWTATVGQVVRLVVRFVQLVLVRNAAGGRRLPPPVVGQRGWDDGPSLAWPSVAHSLGE